MTKKMTETERTNLRIKTRAQLNAACENHGKAYDEGDSATTQHWADQRDRLGRLLDRLS